MDVTTVANADHSTDLLEDIGLVVLIPAHNEEAQLAACLDSVLGQTFPADRVVVVADNCTDRTVEIASSYPFTVLETVGNRDRKAGALNQAWHRYGQDAHLVVTIDADTVLDRQFLERLTVEMLDDTGIGGSCAGPSTKPVPRGISGWSSLLWRLVGADYASSSRITRRRRGATDVIAGYAAILRNDALHQVAARNDGIGPWNPASIVEDYRLSLDLRELGHRITVSPTALAFTDSPLTVRELWRQRVRWSAGTMEELVRVG